MIESNGESDGVKHGTRLKMGDTGPTNEPDWTVGLKRLYDSVVEEPIPDNFRNLLAKLDDDNNT